MNHSTFWNNYVYFYYTMMAIFNVTNSNAQACKKGPRGELILSDKKIRFSNSKFLSPLIAIP